MTRQNIRNVAIVAHVDHGKTSLVDQLLRQSGQFRKGELVGDCILDSNPLERERGITILAKNCAIDYVDRRGERYHINIVDTPGHADFSGEVERVLKMADGVLLLVDAAEGVMPQTRYVLAKALEAGLRPVVVVNKMDRPDARPNDVHNQVLDLLADLDADDHALDFPTVYASGRDGWAVAEVDHLAPPIPEPGTGDIHDVFDAIIAHVDHGKTTLVDQLLRQSGQFRQGELVGDCILDSNDLERERGITILAKNIAIHYRGVKINLIDTPGHADFGGEVERVLRLADGALVLVDAAEGPMPQTRFVLAKALECGLQPLVVINKIDRRDAQPHTALNQTFELMLDLGAEDVLGDFPHMFATSREGYATVDPDQPGDSMQPLLDMLLEVIPGPTIDAAAPLSIGWPQSSNK